MDEKLFIPYLLRDGVVLQRNKKFCFWGYTTSCNSVRLELNGNVFTTTSNDSGYFEFEILPQEASGPFEITIETQNRRVKIHDVLFGDVWLLGGQSNMQLWMDRLKTRYPRAISEASNSNIRFFIVPQHFNFNCEEDELGSGEWKRATSPDIQGLSGIGYFFAQQQYAKNHVPVGLISTAIGGTHVRSWVSYQTLSRLHELPTNFDRLKSPKFLEAVQRDEDRYQEQFLKTADETDMGGDSWQSSNYDDSDWRSIDLSKQLPKPFRYPGVIWFRKRVHVPPKMVGSVAQLSLGTFVDADETFVDGQMVGHTDYQYPPREYVIGELKSTFELVIRLKVFNYPGGARCGKKHLLIANGETLDLDKQGLWKIARGNWLPERKEQIFLQYEPVGLFNGMISPLKRLNIAGILWYQGESDTGEAHGYGKVFKALISEWRHLFKDNKLPFLYVQLPNCGIEPSHVWAAIRQEQIQGICLAHTGMVVSLGLGEDNDLHPTDKKTIAEKLSYALENVGKYTDGYCTGPLAVGACRNSRKIVVQFKTFEHQLILKGIPMFEVFTRNRWYSLSGGEVRNNTVSVETPGNMDLSEIELIRYGWGNTPKISIENESLDPASPFCLRVFENVESAL